MPSPLNLAIGSACDPELFNPNAIDVVASWWRAADPIAAHADGVVFIGGTTLSIGSTLHSDYSEFCGA